MFTATRRRSLLVLLVSFAFIAFPAIASANHSWGGYHWARTSNPFTLKLGDNVSSAWDAYLGTTSSDWSLSDVLDTAIVAGRANPKNCRATSGRVEVCNSTYGNNGWLGVAQIWISGGHIVQGAVKLNDTYFKTAAYNTPAWRNLVMCQEVGHTFGLDHQDETFGNQNLGTCMDYTNDPDGALYNQLSNEHPNQHDYDELGIIYSHLDSTTSVGQTTLNGPMPPAMNDIDFETPAQWGKLIRSSNLGRTGLYELDFGGGHKVFTFVIWADGEKRGRR
jgi:hypothetical protein